jgi:hypothetical protein
MQACALTAVCDGISAAAGAAAVDDCGGGGSHTWGHHTAYPGQLVVLLWLVLCVLCSYSMLQQAAMHTAGLCQEVKCISRACSGDQGSDAK